MTMRLMMLVAAALLGACAVIPNPFSNDAHRERATADRAKLFAEQEPLSGQVTLDLAMARAIKYNMEYRTRLMEQAAAARQLDVAQFDLLPRLTVNAGYSTRSNEAYSFGVQPNGIVTTSPSTAVERTHSTITAGFAWNVIDFGVSYYRANQVADQSLIAEERRRKALQNLIQDVRFTWWRAESADRLLPELDALVEDIDAVVARARLIEARKVLPPLQIAAFRRTLLDLDQQLALRRQELAQAKLDLGALMNLRPGTDYQVKTQATTERNPPDLVGNIDALEQVALENRPELREEAYRSRIAQLEAKKSLLALLPNPGIDLSGNYDSNRFLVNNSWAAAGLSVAYNLTRAFSAPAVKRSSEAQQKVEDTRRLAVTMAVLAQTRLSAVRYQLLTQEWRVWEQAGDDDTRIVEYLTAAKSVGLETELEQIRARARLMITRINRDLVYSNLQAAIGRIYNSVGLDSLPRETDSHETADLGRELERQIGVWEKANFSTPERVRFTPVRLLPPKGIPDDGMKIFQNAMQRVIRLSRIPVTTGDSPFNLSVTLEMTAEAGDATRPTAMKIQVSDAAGAKLAEAEQRTTLVEPISPEQWQAMGESAGYRIVEPLRRLVVREARTAVKTN
jgi:outer membrane protein TolC